MTRSHEIEIQWTWYHDRYYVRWYPIVIWCWVSGYAWYNINICLLSLEERGEKDWLVTLWHPSSIYPMVESLTFAWHPFDILLSCCHHFCNAHYPFLYLSHISPHYHLDIPRHGPIIAHHDLAIPHHPAPLSS
jgi:hypothetical protein